MSKYITTAMDKPYRQRGMSMTGWLAIIVVLAMLGKFGVAIGPAMYENYMLRDALKSIAELPNLREISKGDIQKRLSSSFMVNNIRMIPSSAIKLEKGPDRTWIIDVHWISIEPFFGDIYLTNVFFNRLNTAKPDECCALEFKEKEAIKAETLVLLKASASEQAKNRR